MNPVRVFKTLSGSFGGVFLVFLGLLWTRLIHICAEAQMPPSHKLFAWKNIQNRLNLCRSLFVYPSIIGRCDGLSLAFLETAGPLDPDLCSGLNTAFS